MQATGSDAIAGDELAITAPKIANANTKRTVKELKRASSCSEGTDPERKLAPAKWCMIPIHDLCAMSSN
jgi:hypothetical protein